MRKDVLREQMKGRLERARAALDAKRATEVRREAAFAYRLTGEPVWDRYLELLAKLSEAARTELEQVEAEMAGGGYLPAEELARLHHLQAVLKARVGAIDECARIPGELISQAASARQAGDGVMALRPLSKTPDAV